MDRCERYPGDGKFIAIVDIPSGCSSGWVASQSILSSLLIVLEHQRCRSLRLRKCDVVSGVSKIADTLRLIASLTLSTSCWVDDNDILIVTDDVNVVVDIPGSLSSGKFLSYNILILAIKTPPLNIELGDVYFVGTFISFIVLHSESNTTSLVSAYLYN